MGSSARDCLLQGAGTTKWVGGQARTPQALSASAQLAPNWRGFRMAAATTSGNCCSSCGDRWPVSGGSLHVAVLLFERSWAVPSTCAECANAHDDTEDNFPSQLRVAMQVQMPDSLWNTSASPPSARLCMCAWSTSMRVHLFAILCHGESSCLCSVICVSYDPPPVFSKPRLVILRQCVFPRRRRPVTPSLGAEQLSRILARRKLCTCMGGAAGMSVAWSCGCSTAATFRGPPGRW